MYVHICIYMYNMYNMYMLSCNHFRICLLCVLVPIVLVC